MAKILAIDDEPEFLEQVKIFLEQEGHKVETALDGVTGLEKVSQFQPGLILLDIIMPGMDGFEVLKRLSWKQGTNQIPVVMLTAKGETESVFKAQDLSAMDYLIKPFTAESLLEVVNRYTL